MKLFLVGYACLVVGFTIGFLFRAWLEIRAKDAAEAEKQLRPLLDDVEHKRSLMRGWKGCPDCFGSGGKRRNPCPKCDGSSRLDVKTGEPYKKNLTA